MKDEIKEILRNCEKAINEASGYNDTTDKILDCITNLQEKYDKCKKQKIKVENACSNYKYVIDKAIEYMEQCRDTKTKRIDSRLKRVLNILQGSDK